MPRSPSHAGDLGRFLDAHGEAVLARLDRVRGSSPREAGAWMVITADAIHGTIGGGQLEYTVINKAHALLAEGGNRSLTLDVPLGAEIGQCCGGRVCVSLARLDARGRAAALAAEAAAHRERPVVHVFGAGHVGRALAAVLALMPVRGLLIDTRAGELALAGDGIETRLTAIPENIVREAAPGAAFVVMTHEHALDFLITAEALARKDAFYVGMIGSRTKRAVFEQWHRRTFGLPVGGEALTCPIGAGAGGDKRPQTIAVLAAAELMTRLSAFSAAGSGGEDRHGPQSGSPA